VAYWGVADIEAAVRHLQAVGASEEAAISDVGDGIRVAVLSDPFGNAFGVIQNPHFKTAD
jgi:predicted enzyme related to lactoylglutathione lyase